MKYASIVPLIGGQTLGMQKTWGNQPEYFLSFAPFKNNDQHIVQYMKDVPYHVIEDALPFLPKVDVVSTTCPCAGLSSLSPKASGTSATNDWMFKTAELVLEQIKPQVFWGENAPRLATKLGKPVSSKLRQIAAKHGYTFSMYKTKSILHGLSQVRHRSFYFFWRGDRTPIFEYFNTPNERIEDVIRSATTKSHDPMQEMIPNKSIPSSDPLYRFVLEELEGGITHQQFVRKITRTTNPMDYLEDRGIKYADVSEWMKSKGFDRQAARCNRIHAKLESGGSIMRKTTEIPSDRIGAFVGHMPTMLSHPDLDRYITVRESLQIMKMPMDFQLQGGIRNLNHICQNVPVTTARDMSMQIERFLQGKLNTVGANFVIQDNCNQTVEDVNSRGELQF